MPANVAKLGHVGHRATQRVQRHAAAVLNISRDSMAAIGFSPATRVFEAAGAGACLITDAWEGIELFLAPDEEVLVARDGRMWPQHLQPDAGAARRDRRAAHRRILRRTHLRPPCRPRCTDCRTRR